jgi:hypothetical protein
MEAAAALLIPLAAGMNVDRSPRPSALGAQAGEARLTDLLHEAGFSHVRRAAETPFNLVLEARR